MIAAYTLVIMASLVIAYEIFTPKTAASEYAAIINKAGYQRMLSQRVAMYATRYAFSADKSQDSHLKSEIKIVNEKLYRNLNFLSQKKYLNFLSNRYLKRVNEIYFEGSGSIKSLIEKIKSFSDTLTKTTKEPEKQKIANDIFNITEYDLLNKLDTIVQLYQDNEPFYLDTLNKTQKYILSCMLLIILVAIAIVFIPMEQTIIAQYQEILDNYQLKDDILSIFSHELRTPLTSIHGALSNMKYCQENPTDNFLRMLDLAEKNCNKIILLIEDILMIQEIKFEKAKLEMQKVDIHEELIKIIEKQNPLAKEKRIKIDLIHDKTDLSIFADMRYLGRVFASLLNNAIKFSYNDTEIRIVATSDHNQIEVSIIDNGPGISKKDQQNIYHHFSQLDRSSTRAHDGIGIGLSLAKLVLELHHGSLKLDSIRHKGAAFTVTLPKRQPRTS